MGTGKVRENSTSAGTPLSFRNAVSDLRRQILDARSPLSVQFLPPAKEVWGVGFPSCTGKGEGGWLPCMHWEGGLASQHAPELGKAGSMHPTGMLFCLYFG